MKAPGFVAQARSQHTVELPRNLLDLLNTDAQTRGTDTRGDAVGWPASMIARAGGSGSGRCEDVERISADRWAYRWCAGGGDRRHRRHARCTWGELRRLR